MLRFITYPICLTALLLLPLTLKGQQTGASWAGGKLRQQAAALSTEIPFATVAYDFAERYLTMLQKLSPEEQKTRLMRDDVKIVAGDLNLIGLIDAHTAMLFAETDEHRYRVAFQNGNTPLMDISFPASCQLLTGKNLKELEQEFLTGLSAFRYQPSENLPWQKQKAVKQDNGLYLYEGETYYIQEINRHLYAKQEGGELKLIFDAAWPVESVYNLLQDEETAKETVLDLTVRKYGLRKEQTACPLRNCMAYLHAAGCELYVGIERIDADKVCATLFAVNKVLNYNHVMNVEVSRSVFAAKAEGEKRISGDITLFVPMHNVATLFGELENND